MVIFWILENKEGLKFAKKEFDQKLKFKIELKARNGVRWAKFLPKSPLSLNDRIAL